MTGQAKRFARIRAVAITVCAAALWAAPFRIEAISTNAEVRNVPYVVAYQPSIGGNGATPYSGKMTLNYDRGIVSGRYTDESIKPGAPFAQRPNTSVSGGVNGHRIHFTIGGSFSFNGTIEGETISGSATYRGRIYNFMAKQGKAKNT